MDEKEIFVINGGKQLRGEIEVHAAKNAVLPLIACSILIKDTVVLEDCEPLTDVLAMLKIIKSLGGDYSFDGTRLTINCKKANGRVVGPALTTSLRSSVFILGSLISRGKSAEISYPGGCDIGVRPIDIHLDGLRSMGVNVTENDEKILCDGKHLHSGTVLMAFPSVGATENLMMAATLTEGRTVLHNAATEPEIVDLQNFINAMGGSVHGAGTGTIIIDGVKSLHGGVYKPTSDRIVAGTYLIAGAMCGGSVTVRGIRSDYLIAVTAKLRAAGVTITERTESVTVESDGNTRMLRKVDTQPYPGFPTDLQAPIMAMMASSKGRGYVIENLFENRFRHTEELNKMGADIIVCGRAATVKGGALHGEELFAGDLRGGAALVLAALKAEGESTVSGLHHIDRGYYEIENKICMLGGDIKRVKKSCV